MCSLFASPNSQKGQSRPEAQAPLIVPLCSVPHTSPDHIVFTQCTYLYWILHIFTVYVYVLLYRIFLCVSIYICTYIHSIYLSIYLPTYLSIYLSTYLSIYLSNLNSTYDFHKILENHCSEFTHQIFPM